MCPSSVVKEFPKGHTTTSAVQLGQADTIDATYKLTMIYLHDHNTGLPRGQAQAKLHLAKEDGTTKYDHGAK